MKATNEDMKEDESTHSDQDNERDLHNEQIHDQIQNQKISQDTYYEAS